MIRRPRRGVPAAIVALLLLAGCVLITVACIQLITGKPPVIPFDRIAGLGRRLRWRDTEVLVAGGIVAGLGIILLACAIIPGRRTVLPLARDAASPMDAGLTRRALRETLRRSVVDADGVAGASVKVRGRTVVADVATHRDDQQEVRETVLGAIEGELDSLALADRPRSKVHVRARRVA